MKKALSLLIAMTMFFSLGITAFAFDGEITFGADENGNVLGRDTVLEPWQVYEFPINIKTGGDTKPLTNEIGDKYKTRLENVKGRNAVQEISVKKGREYYYLEIKIAPFSYTDQIDVEYNLKLTNKSDSKDTATANIMFTAGFKTVSNEYINSLEAGDEITVNPDTPVFTKDQLEKIASLNNYKPVTFTDGNWYYTVNVTNKGPVNMMFDTDVIKPLLEKYPDVDFKFLSFPAGPQFSNSKLKIDVSDISEDFGEKFHTYFYYNDKLTKISSEYDPDELMLSMNVTGLGRFVIADRELATSGTISGGSNNTNNPNTPNNPNTGASNNKALALVALLSSSVGLYALYSKIK